MQFPGGTACLAFGGCIGSSSCSILFARQRIMRCPKCGYISFDQMEICGGCKKNIAKFSKDLSGVVFKSESPDFLWFKQPEEEVPEEEMPEDEAAEEEESDGVDFALDEEESADSGSDVEFAVDSADSGLDISADQPQEIEFDLSADIGTDEEPEQEEAKEEIAFDLPDMEETVSAPKPENARKEEDMGLSLETTGSAGGLDDLGLDFDFDDSAAAPAKPAKAAKPEKKESPLDLDLAGLDLDGLMPPSAEEEAKVDFSFSGLGDLSLEGAPEQAPSKKTAGGRSSKSADSALPDLAMEGLDDLGGPPALPSKANAAGKKLQPASKTGTALDEFDIDLGDLLGGENK